MKSLKTGRFGARLAEIRQTRQPYSIESSQHFMRFMYFMV